MGLFSKKEEKKEFSLPKLPELPKLPNQFGSLPNFEDSHDEEIHELPSFPTTSLGEKFSQNTIKSAIEGKEDEDFFEIEKPILPRPDFIKNPKEEVISSFKPLRRPTNEEFRMKQAQNFSQKEEEPVFIRIDKFEETIKIIRETKEKIEEMEDLLIETKELKKKEEEELSLWEKEIQQMKQHIERIDKDIFSKI